MDMISHEMLKVSLEALKSSYPSFFQDLLEPATRETSELVARVPAVINACFADVDIWVMKRRQKVALIQKELQEQLSSVPPDQIIEPQQFIFVPAIEAFSYSYDSEELKSLFLNLLVKSMQKEYENKVHPAFVEIIKQLSPLDACILKKISDLEFWPIIDIHYEDKKDEKIGGVLRRNITCIDDQDHANDLVSMALDNLERFKLFNAKGGLPDNPVYTSITSSKHYTSLFATLEESNPSLNLEPFYRGIEFSDFGKSFAAICLN